MPFKFWGWPYPLLLSFQSLLVDCLDTSQTILPTFVMQYSKLEQDEEARLDEDRQSHSSYTGSSPHWELRGSKWFWVGVLILYSILLLLAGV